MTSTKYGGALPHVVLVGNYRFLPVDRRREDRYEDAPLEPYGAYSAGTRKLIKELSFAGPCAYVETDFSVEGVQRAEVCRDGVLAMGPLLSFHGYHSPFLERLHEQYAAFTIVDEAINDCLREIGIYRHEGLDEFASARLHAYDDNHDFHDEFLRESQER